MWMHYRRPAGQHFLLILYVYSLIMCKASADIILYFNKSYIELVLMSSANCTACTPSYLNIHLQICCTSFLLNRIFHSITC